MGQSKPAPVTARHETTSTGIRVMRARERESIPNIESPRVDPQAIQRSNSMLFLIAAVCGSTFVTTSILDGALGEAATWFIALLLATALAWLAFALREKGYQALWTGVVGVAAVSTLLLLVPELSSHYILAGMLAIVLWSGMLLHPGYNALLAVYCVVGLAAVGALGEREYDLGLLLLFLAVPLGLGAILFLRQREARSGPKAVTVSLERQLEELKRRLEGKIDELELSREQLFEAQKLKTVGTMASGLAHELNNILTPIRGHAELLAEGATKPEQRQRYGKRILESAKAAEQITNALLTYTRQGSFTPQRTDLGDLLDDQILPMLSKALPSSVELDLDLSPDIYVDIDRVLFQQAIANLVFNAVDAMPEGGKLTVRLRRSSLAATEEEQESIDENDGVERTAMVQVADTGTGIDDEHIDQIFDPFFTTKAVGSGSGLGLAWVMGTITRHHGRVLLESVIGSGTTFTLLLPLAAEAKADKATEDADEDEADRSEATEDEAEADRSEATEAEAPKPAPKPASKPAPTAAETGAE